MIIYKSSTPKMLWKVLANKLCVVVCKPIGMDDIRCIIEVDDEPQCTFQISKAEGTFNCGQPCYSLPKDVGRGESFGFWLCSWAIKLLLSYHILLQVWYNPWSSPRRSLLEWVLSRFDSSTTHHAVRNVMPNLRQDILQCSQVWRETSPQIIRNNWRMSKIVVVD